MAIRPDMKSFIAETFIEMLEKKNADDISVSDIAEAAEISRTTFYYHFKDKYALVEWIYQRAIADILERNNDVQKWKNLTFECLELSAVNPWFKKLSVKFYTQNSLFEFVCDAGYQYLKQIILKELKEESLPENVDFSIKMYSTATAYMQKNWILGGAKISSEKMASLLNENLPQVLIPYLCP